MRVNRYAVDEVRTVSNVSAGGPPAVKYHLDFTVVMHLTKPGGSRGTKKVQNLSIKI